MTKYLERMQFVAWIAIFMWLGILLVWANDRTPPPAATNYTARPAKVGGVVFIEAGIDRQLHRGCSRTYSRYIVDSTGTRLDLHPMSAMGMATVWVLEEESPGLLKMAFTVPAGAAPGEAVLLEDFNYTCNPVHRISPIRAMTKYKFKVLP